MTRNKEMRRFQDMPRKDQNRIAGAIARGEPVEWWEDGKWVTELEKRVYSISIYRLPKQPKAPNRARPAHKLNLQKDDVVRLVGWENDSEALSLEIQFGRGRDSRWLQTHIDNPRPKGQRPLFVVVSRAR